MARDINDVVVVGFGAWSDINALPTLGFGIGAAVAVPTGGRQIHATSRVNKIHADGRVAQIHCEE